MIVDPWISRKMGLAAGERLTREKMEAWQLARLRTAVRFVKERSSWYAARLSGVDPNRDLQTLADLNRLPFMTPEDLMEAGEQMVCVPASHVSRIVTLETSGTTGRPKRVYFTEADQELMVDYIANGLKVMVAPTDVFLILMPCQRPGSVGDLVRIGVDRIGARTIPVGILPYDGSRDEEILRLMETEGVSSMLATASAAARLAEKSKDRPGVAGPMRTVLLSAEHVSDEQLIRIDRGWDCKAYEHYGMTEMGLGGAMACAARVGYHPREADILFEIINPETGEVLGEGEWGEVVFTTLTREAMPFLRYRTGDVSRWIPGACPCGSILRRLDRVGDRKVVKGY